MQLLHDVLGGGQGEAGDRALHQRGPARLHLGQVDILISMSISIYFIYIIYVLSVLSKLLNITQVAGGRGSQEHTRRGGLLSAVIIFIPTL